MNFVYYVVRKKDMVVLDGAEDMVNAVNMGQQQNCACLILQGCVITEIGQDVEESEPMFESEDSDIDYDNSYEDDEIIEGDFEAD